MTEEKTKRKSGISIDLALRKRDRALTRLIDLYSRARQYGALYSQLHGDFLEIITKECNGAPQWVKEFLRGYERALNDNLYREFLTFGCYIDGKFYSNDSKRADYYETQGMSARIYCEKSTGNKTIGHYWKHNLKPYSVSYPSPGEEA